MPILPKEYPEKILNSEEQSVLDVVVVEEMFLGVKVKLQFTSIHFHSGMLLVDCVTTHIVRWLMIRVSRLNNWKGVKLIACVE